MSTISNKARRFCELTITCLVLVGWSLAAQAQGVCTIDNWQVNDVPAAVGLDNSNVGQPNETDADGRAFRRYAGPCGLRVPLDDEPRYVRDGSPAAESEYKVRFYVFLNDLSGNVLLFEAVDSAGDPLIEIWYDHANSVFAADMETGSGAENLGELPAAPGWNSIQFQWGSVTDEDGVLVEGVNAEFIVNESNPIRANLDLKDALLTEARLGNVSGANGGYLDFDDFDSRRSMAPGRLLVGDANGDGRIGVGDLVAILSELNSLSFASGQPDCNQDGRIGVGDLVCVLTILNQ